MLTLGCSKNLVDSEYLLRQLEQANVNARAVDNINQADTIIINTCGFILDAKQESIDTILEAVEAKKEGRLKRIFVTGCLSERYKSDLQELIHEVDGFFGAYELKNIIAALGIPYSAEIENERMVTTPPHYAYLKIAEGCNRKCSFCAIPLIKGKYKSRSIKDIVHEAEYLALHGVKELMLIAQDLSYFGYDTHRKKLLPQLLDELSLISGIEWIRLHYTYPAGFPVLILDQMRENPKICKYLDIPFQHISNNMLRLMQRGINKEKTLQLIHKIREKVPGIALRTTLMVGHPGETREDFRELLEFVLQTRFERLGVFTYSHEEDTVSYRKYKDEIRSSDKEMMAGELMNIQQDISKSLNEAKEGEIFKTIIDRREGDYFIGRTELDSPEVDNEVLVSACLNPEIKVGQFYDILITRADVFDLHGEPA